MRTSSVPERRVPARSSRGKPCHELTHHVRAGLVEGQLALDGIARNNLGEHFMLPMEARPALEPQTEADISYFLRRQSNFSPRSSQDFSFRFRSQMVCRHTDSAARRVNTPRLSPSAVCLCGVTTESSERGTAPSRKAIASIPPSYIKDRSQAARSLAVPPVQAFLLFHPQQLFGLVTQLRPRSVTITPA